MNISPFAFSLAFFLFGQLFSVYAQDFALKSLTLDQEDGLLSTNLVSVYQDTRGIVWMATSEGISSYDGTRVRNYTAADGLCHPYSLLITEDAAGKMWIYGGAFGRRERCVSILDPITGEIKGLEDYLGTSVPFDVNLTHMSPAYAGTILFREEQQDQYQFYEWNGAAFTKGFVFPKSNQIAPFGLREFVLKYDSVTYVGELIMNEGKTVRSMEQHRIMFFDHAGRITRTFPEEALPGFLSTDGTRLFFKYGEYTESATWSFYVDEKLMYEEVIPFRGNDFMFWGDRLGFLFLDQELRIHYPHGDSLAVETLIVPEAFQPTGAEVFLDRSDALWLKSGNQIVRLSVKRQHIRSDFQFEEFNGWTAPIRGITQDANENLWIGSQHYLFSITSDGQSHKMRNTLNGDLMKGILGVLYTGERLWLAMEYTGLWCYDPQTGSGEVFGFDSPQRINSLLWQPFQAPDGKIWIGAGEGLYILDRAHKKLVPFKPDKAFEQLATSSVFHFYPHQAGTWLSTSSGLYLVDLVAGKVLARYHRDMPAPFDIPCEQVAHMYEDETGTFWLATKGQGLIQWDPQSNTHTVYNRENSGLSHDVLYAVYEDEFGNLWLPSSHGLNRFHKESGQVNIYLEEDGLPHPEFNTTSHYQRPDGRLYFGTQNGLIWLDPKDFVATSSEIPLYIREGLRIDRQTDTTVNVTTQLLTDHSLELHPSDRAVHIRLALLDYEQVKGREYAYKIDGIHDTWIPAEGADIKLAGLPYGQHDIQFRARSASSNQWIYYPELVRLTVIRPFFLQFWFILSGVALIIGLTYGIFQYNTRRLRMRQIQLEQIVAERTEEMRQQAEELKALDQAKSRFFANISHELRTPLTLILGPLSFLRKNAHRWDELDLASHFQVMERNGKSLMHLIEEILDLTKLKDRKLKLDASHTEVQGFVDRVVAFFRPQYAQKEITLEVHHELTEGLVLAIDQKKLQQVLNNFLSNALKFTLAGGQVSISVTETSHALTFKVQDNGKGIHPEDLPHIFDRFYQGQNHVGLVDQGTGIGLELVREYAQLMGGKAYAESMPGQGSTFYFVLPKEPLSPVIIPDGLPEEGTAASGLKPLSQAHTLVVVEDNADMRTFIQGILQEQYAEVITLPHGKACVALLEERAQDISLIISDVMMPEMDGITLLNEIKTNLIWAHIPMVMLTAMGSERTRLGALTMGVDDYLTKPFSVEELQIRLHNQLLHLEMRSQSEHDPTQDTPAAEAALPETYQPTPADQSWIKQVEETVVKALGVGPINVERLADASAMSQRQLRRRIKSITGLTPNKYIREVQLQAARHELEDGQYQTLAEVAYRFGFEHPATFSTLFKARFGKAPSQYLKTISNGMYSIEG